VDLADTEDSDLIVMSTHGRSGLARMVFGSVAEEVMRRASCPVLLVPALCSRTWADGHPWRVVIPLDGSVLAETAVGPGFDLAATLDAEVLFVQVVPPRFAEGEASARVFGWPDERERIAQADAYLDLMVRKLGAGETVIRIRTVAGDPVHEIGRAAQSPITAAVAMATHGQSGWGQMLLGSVAAGVLHHAPVPLLVVRPEGLSRYT
jgi:nucleotide-binding universal stress UspA family protein